MLRITDEQWERIRKHFPEEHFPDDRPGRKPIPARKVLEAVLWILNTGAQWHMLPQSYPNYKTVHRRFQQWCQNEVIRAALTDLANALREEGAIDESECFIDATFASAKGGGEQIGPTRRGKGVKIMAIVDRKRKTQDGRRLRRYERRWSVERFFAWLQWQRRLLVRWEYYPANFLGFVQLAALGILLRQF